MLGIMLAPFEELALTALREAEPGLKNNRFSLRFRSLRHAARLVSCGSRSRCLRSKGQGVSIPGRMTRTPRNSAAARSAITACNCGVNADWKTPPNAAARNPSVPIFSALPGLELSGIWCLAVSAESEWTTKTVMH